MTFSLELRLERLSLILWIVDWLLFVVLLLAHRLLILRLILDLYGVHGIVGEVSLEVTCSFGGAHLI